MLTYQIAELRESRACARATVRAHSDNYLFLYCGRLSHAVSWSTRQAFSGTRAKAKVCFRNCRCMVYKGCIGVARKKES